MADTSTNGSTGAASSSSSAGSGGNKHRVEYLAKVKYRNTLPPPPFPPRLVDYDLDTTQLLNAGSLSSVFLQRSINPEVDVELGIPIDLSGADAAFDPEKSEEAMCPPFLDDSQLDPEDLALLAEPEISEETKTGQGSFASMATSSNTPLSRASDDVHDGAVTHSSSEIGMGTSFLRRTAYMSGDTRRASKRKTATSAPNSGSKESNVDAEIRRIEQTFQDAKMPLSELRHPSKRKNVHAVSATPLFPDFKETDLTFTDVRLVGSASLRSLNTKPTEKQLKAAVFHRKNFTDVEKYEWVSLFIPENEQDAEKLNNYRHELRDTLPAEEAQEEEQTEFALQKLQDNDLKILRPQQKFEEVVISQNGLNSYIYVPISARYNLTRRRVDPALKQQLAVHEVDVLDLGIRELTPQESIQRDEVRSIYDPVNYG